MKSHVPEHPRMSIDAVPDSVEEALDEFGELIVITDAGERYELHKHNVDFENGWIVIEGPDKYLFVDTEKVEGYEIHYDM